MRSDWSPHAYASASGKIPVTFRSLHVNTGMKKDGGVR